MTQADLEKLSTEELMALKNKNTQMVQQMASGGSQRSQGILPNIGGALLAGLKGGLENMSGRVPKDTSSDFAEKIALERIKQEINPDKWQPTTREEALSFEKEKTLQSLPYQKYQQKQEDAGVTNEAKTQKILADSQEMLDAIQKAKKGKQFFGFGGEWKSNPVLTGMDYDSRIEWESNMNQLLAKKGLDIMMQLKEASKTGATGFGNLSEAEGLWLRQASTTLNKRLSPDVAMEYLDKMEKLYKKVTSGGGSIIPQAGEKTGQDSGDPEYQAYLQSIGG